MVNTRRTLHAQGRTQISPSRLPKQQGATLIVVLVMLLLVTVFSVASMNGVVLQERMAGNMRDSDLALQAAEAALLEAEEFVQSGVNENTLFSAACNSGLCTRRNFNEPFDRWNNPDFCGADKNIFDEGCNKSIEATETANDIANNLALAKSPRYIVEELSEIQPEEATLNMASGYGDNSAAPEITIYRITVEATGGSEKAKAITQSTFAKTL